MKKNILAFVLLTLAVMGFAAPAANAQYYGNGYGYTYSPINAPYSNYYPQSSYAGYGGYGAYGYTNCTKGILCAVEAIAGAASNAFSARQQSQAAQHNAQLSANTTLALQKDKDATAVMIDSNHVALESQRAKLAYQTTTLNTMEQNGQVSGTVPASAFVPGMPQQTSAAGTTAQPGAPASHMCDFRAVDPTGPVSTTVINASSVPADKVGRIGIKVGSCVQYFSGGGVVVLQDFPNSISDSWHRNGILPLESKLSPTCKVDPSAIKYLPVGEGHANFEITGNPFIVNDSCLPNYDGRPTLKHRS